MSGDPSLQPHTPHEKPPRRCDRHTSSIWGIYPGSAHVMYCTNNGAVAVLTKNLGRDCALWESVRMPSARTKSLPPGYAADLIVKVQIRTRQCKS